MDMQALTILGTDGKILLYSLNDFYKRIVLGNDCFICGATRDSKKFNDEHILPDWILKKYKLHNKFITLPNLTHIEYSKYKIPCCADCNSELGKRIEIPVSKLLKLSYTEISDAIRSDQRNLFLLFRWLMLIFFKTHLKDTSLNWNLNRKEGTEKISDFYDWSEMHHLHCMIRKDYTNAAINSKTIGSTFILPAIQHNSLESFDFVDNKNGLGVMIRLDEFCMISILNDSCGALNLCQDLLSKINAPLTPFQLREVFTHFVILNMHLKERPQYYSEFSRDGKYRITAQLPKMVELIEDNLQLKKGELLYHYCKDMIGDIDNKELILDEIRQGKRGYLFNEKGNFIDHSKDFK